MKRDSEEYKNKAVSRQSQNRKEEQKRNKAARKQAKAAARKAEEQKPNEAARKQAKAATRKAETRALAEQEEKELEKSLKNKPTKKVTQAQLVQVKEQQYVTVQKQAEEEKLKQSRVAVKKEYEKVIIVQNTNRSDDGSVLDANTIDKAIALMTTDEQGDHNLLPGEAAVMSKKKHLEKKMMAAAEGKKGTPLARLARDDEERSLFKNVQRINLDSFCFEEFEDGDSYDYDDDYSEY